MLKSDQEKIKKKIGQKAYFTIGITVLLSLLAFVIAIQTFIFELLYLILSVISVFIGIFLFIIITKNLRRDLNTGKTKVQKQEIKNITSITKLVPGDKSKVDAFLISLSKNVLLDKVNKVFEYTAFTEKDHFQITKEEFEQIKIGQTVSIRRGFYSDLYLGIEKINYA